MRATVKAAGLASLMAMVAVAGCVDEGPDDHFADGHSHGEDEHPAMSLADLPPFQLELKDCVEAGGVSIYNSQDGATGPVEPFLRANNLHDVGAPTIGTYGQPITSDFTTGIWHVAGQCASYTINGEPGPGEFRFGWVGVKVKAPEFDLEGPERQFFVTDLSFMDQEVVKFLRGELGLHATRMLEGGALPIGPQTVNVVMNDEDHGIFETLMTVREHQDLHVEPMRFWLYIPADGDLSHGHSHDASGVDGVKYQPVSLHIENHGSGLHEVTVEGSGWFSHSRTNHHGDDVNGASGNLPGYRWSGFDRTITLGPIPDVQYNNTWLH